MNHDLPTGYDPRFRTVTISRAAYDAVHAQQQQGEDFSSALLRLGGGPGGRPPASPSNGYPADRALCHLILELRRTAGLTQVELARRLRATTALDICRIEHGHLSKRLRATARAALEYLQRRGEAA